MKKTYKRHLDDTQNNLKKIKSGNKYFRLDFNNVLVNRYFNINFNKKMYIINVIKH